MDNLNVSQIEKACLSFRIGRSIILKKIISLLTQDQRIKDPYLTLSHLFCRLKSADSVLEKIKRKKIQINDISEIPVKIPDILGMRIIAETPEELSAVDSMVRNTFEVQSCADKIKNPGEFGDKGIEYSLVFKSNEGDFPFELQLRTFLQHYFAVKTFHLFHKKTREVALPHKDQLLQLSKALETAEIAGSAFSRNINRETKEESCKAITDKVHIAVIEPGEKIIELYHLSLTGNYSNDHEMIAEKKISLYSKHANCAIVECSCIDLSAYILNEPHVWVPPYAIDGVLAEEHV
jgi:putative GTP pyrophosphokinase